MFYFLEQIETIGTTIIEAPKSCNKFTSFMINKYVCILTLGS